MCEERAHEKIKMIFFNLIALSLFAFKFTMHTTNNNHSFKNSYYYKDQK